MKVQVKSWLHYILFESAGEAGGTTRNVLRSVGDLKLTGFPFLQVRKSLQKFRKVLDADFQMSLKMIVHVQI